MTNYIAKHKKVLFGRKHNGEAIYLRPPAWDCNWYWSFGYLGNRNCHYHLENYQKEGGFGQHRNISMFDALKADYELCPSLADDANLWQFCELAATVYGLLEAAKIFHLGGSHYSSNPCKDLLKDSARCSHINEVLLPALFMEIDKIFGL